MLYTTAQINLNQLLPLVLQCTESTLALEQTVLAEVALVQMVQANKPWNPKQALSIQEQLQSVFEINHDLSGELKEVQYETVVEQSALPLTPLNVCVSPLK